MKHKVKLSVIDKNLYPDLQAKYCADPESGECSCCNVGDEFMFYRDDEHDDNFWHMGINTLTKTSAAPPTQQQEAQSCRTVLKHGTQYRDISTPDFREGQLMKGWMNQDNIMITCCSDGTRPVIFKIERIDYE